jgi:DNA-binding transcriptional MerR regulator
MTPDGLSADTGLRIGQAAARAGVSTRTLRYYGELDLVHPSAQRDGGERRYTESDLARLGRVRELQTVMGFNLGEIGVVLSAEDRLQQLREEFDPNMPEERQREIVDEAIAINDHVRGRVREQLALITQFLAELEDKAQRYQRFRGELGT